MSLPRLYSAQEVQAMFPEGSQPTVLTIRRRAREEALCRILGRHMAFTDEDAKELIGRFAFKKIASGYAGKSGTSYVYFVRCHDRVKIGRAKDPARRLIQMQVGCPYPVELLWTCHGGKCDEKYFHTIFAEYRKNGEWFEYSPIIEMFIAEKVARRGFAHLKDKLK